MDRPDRPSEIESVLKELTERIVKYTKDADSPEGKVGNLEDPHYLSEIFELRSECGEGLEGLLRSADLLLQHSVVTWHKAFLEKLYAGTNPVGVASDLLLSVLNTNSHVFTASPALTVIEKNISHRYAKMFGFDGARAGGLTFPGGSYSNLTSMHMARALLFPQTRTTGNAGAKLAVFTSAHAHYSVEKAAILLGLGSDAVFKVAVKQTGEMDMDDLEHRVLQAKRAGWTPFYLNATAGSTVYGSFDDLERAASVTQREHMWLHVDGSWGGNVVFSSRYRYKLRGSSLAHSITVNPHKMLGVPCTCSFLLVPDTGLFHRANSLSAPYLFHSSGDEDDNWDLADGTMGCGRRSDALKLYLGWQWYGTDGYGARIDRAFEMTQYLAKKVIDTPGFFLISEYPPPCLQTCFFYNPNGRLDREENSNITRHVVKSLLAKSKFLIDFSLDSEQGEFFRVVINAPTVTEELLDDLISSIIDSAPGL